MYTKTVISSALLSGLAAAAPAAPSSGGLTHEIIQILDGQAQGSGMGRFVVDNAIIAC